jgi:glycosyltransferase involved in cell wall biosynthesis
MPATPLVTIGLPVRNAGTRLVAVVESVLRQTYQPLELVISDNASTDDTESVCRHLAASDQRIIYHRQPTNIGLLNNFIHVMTAGRGEFFRWIGDDDRLEPEYVSACVSEMTRDPRLILVTSQIAYRGPDGDVNTAKYDGHGLGSDDPVVRLAEMLRLLNESHLLIDPLYGLMRREPVAAIPRRNMLREDEIFASKLALAGPWTHVPEVLAHRNWNGERIGKLSRRLNVPSWQARFANTLQYREMLRWVAVADLTDAQQTAARAAVRRWFLTRQRRSLGRRARKALRLAIGRHG